MTLGGYRGKTFKQMQNKLTVALFSSLEYTYRYAYTHGAVGIERRRGVQYEFSPKTTTN
jgi:hypothetical protein